MKISGQLVDIHKKDIYPAIITIEKGKIAEIRRVSSAKEVFIIPGLVDAHIHIESSMVTPGAFAMTAVKHGTTSVVSDPHEIANVLGIEGVEYMISDSEKVPLKFWFGAPSCVPATEFETSGATLNALEVEKLLSIPDIHYLSEMMNFPGVIYNDTEVKRKIDLAHTHGKPVDGHAPGLTGEMLKKYVAAGISTDHECSTLDEAMEKISLGMKILIREGSAARNLNALKSLYTTNPDSVMLCSDDLHPEMLMVRHINKLVSLLISEGFDPFNVIRSVTINPVHHYNLDGGLLREGDNADFIISDSLNEMNILETWINGVKVFSDNEVMFHYKPGIAINKFNSSKVKLSEIKVLNSSKKIRVIEAFEGELLTKEFFWETEMKSVINSDLEKDILKIVVKDRYNDTSPVVGFIKGFGLKEGAFASCIAHDSHNIISIGTNDKDIVNAINEIVKMRGGLSVVSGNSKSALQLNIAGIMTTRSCKDVASDYEDLTRIIKSMGCSMAAPFMSLSFMALLVIPDLKIGDKGLFDVNKFELVSLFQE